MTPATVTARRGSPATVTARRGSPEVDALLAGARRGLDEAATTGSVSRRYAAAHLAALRAAAAMLAARARAERATRRRPTSVWVLLPKVAPELTEWAMFFAAGAAKRAAAEAGLPAVVTSREADDLLRDAETFIGLVETALGSTAQPGLPLTSRAG